MEHELDEASGITTEAIIASRGSSMMARVRQVQSRQWARVCMRP
jgi:hypothetical protein